MTTAGDLQPRAPKQQPDAQRENPYLRPARADLHRLGLPDLLPLDAFRAVAVLAFDSAWLAQGVACIETIRRRGPAGLHVVVLGMRLSSAERRSLQAMGVDHREMPAELPASPNAPAHSRAMACRPFLRELVPGFDVYFWVDSDVRFLRDDAIEFYLRAATHAARPVVIAAELDPTYVVYHSPRQWSGFVAERHERIARLYGAEAAEAASAYPQFNAGLWAMHRESPVWDEYRAHVERAATSAYDRLSEQDAMNLAIFATRMCAWTAPATHNWICSMALPLFNAGTSQWMRPAFPYVPIAVAHLTDQRGFLEYNGERALLGELYGRLGLR